MFYSKFMFVKKGPLSKVWLAAHFHRKLNKLMVQGTDICLSAKSVLDPAAPLALRLSGQLLLGLVRIYQKKVKYLQDDCSDALSKMKMVLRHGNVNLAEDSGVASAALITHPDNLDDIDFAMPDMPLDSLDNILDMPTVDSFSASQQQITLEDQGEDMRDMNLMDDVFGELLPFDEGARDISEVEIPRAAEGLEEPDFDLATPHDAVLDASASASAASRKKSMGLAADMSMFDASNDSFGPGALDLGGLDVVPPTPADRRAKLKRKLKKDSKTELASREINEALKDTTDIRLVTGRPSIAFSKRAKLQIASQASLTSLLRQPSGLAGEGALAPELWNVVEMSLAEVSRSAIDNEEQAAQEQGGDALPTFDDDFAGDISFAPEAELAPEAGQPAPAQAEAEAELHVQAEVDVEVEVEMEAEAKHDMVYEEDLEHDRVELDDYFGQDKSAKSGDGEEAGEFSYRTKKMQQLLKNKLSRKPSVTLNELCEGTSRKIAANVFYQLLVLKSHSVIQVAQKAPYADITVSNLKQARGRA